MDQSLRKTPLHAIHVASRGRMMAFAGWDLPVQYSGVIDEHQTVRTAAGLFDVSHMGEISVRGGAACEFLQHVTCNNVAKLKKGRAHYTALMTPAGTFVDDLLIYMRGDGDYLLVVNAANTPKDVAWITEHAREFDLVVADESDNWAQLALQGPSAESILQGLVGAPLGEIRYYGFIETDVLGAPCIVSRTGYTGEDGFEIYAPSSNAASIWKAIIDAGANSGIKPIGLAARDTLRLEACMALYGNDIDDTTTVLEANLRWIVKLKKGDFIGRDVLAGQAESGISRKLTGFEMQGRGVARHSYRTFQNDVEIATVTSGTFAPFLKKSIGLTYLPADSCEVGTEFEIEIRGRRQSAIVVPTPFYKRQA